MDYNLAKKFIESLIFSASEPLHFRSLQKILEEHNGVNLEKILKDLEEDYKDRGVNLEIIQGRYFFKTSPILEPFLKIETTKTRNLSPAAMETLAIISYHQPVTRSEIEKIRGKPVFRGILDSLLELKWIKPSGRRETPGRPVTWITDFEFLRHFGLKSISELPKVDELESIIL